MSGADLTLSELFFSACRWIADNAAVAYSSEGVSSAIGISILHMPRCMPTWHAVICDASLMKWCSSPLCSDDKGEKGSTGRVNESDVGLGRDANVGVSVSGTRR